MHSTFILKENTLEPRPYPHDLALNSQMLLQVNIKDFICPVKHGGRSGNGQEEKRIDKAAGTKENNWIRKTEELLIRDDADLEGNRVCAWK